MVLFMAIARNRLFAFLRMLSFGWLNINVRTFLKAKGADSVNASSSGSWSPPAHGCLKLNIDAAVSDTRNYTGVGVVIRDSLVENDSKNASSTIHHCDSVSLESPIVDDSKTNCNLLDNAVCSYVPRSRNVAAYNLSFLCSFVQFEFLLVV
ncbi:hypothetical protein TorRG33x02_182950 [Trema orientale]|uniref:RNase H type-1 domain-containing protein n=1 Tax=Trema orientale TaxID=63057 RepID=A0A2P5EKA9_TREOI|nr:hypothetical protein TorRG33x02_182950 [Trema orientale]